MKKINYKILVLISLGLSQLCFSENSDKSYSELLKEAVQKSGRYRNGYNLLSCVPVMGDMEWGGMSPPRFIRFVDGLDEKEAIPFFENVIQNGPDWNKEEFRNRKKYDQASHIARCYAALSIASMREAEAYSLLENLLQSGAYLTDPNSFGNREQQQKYDIRIYAAYGLGVIADGNSLDLLVNAMDDMNPHLRFQSMFSLAKLNDSRAIRPVLDAACKHEIDDFALDSCMYKMTKFKVRPKLNRDENEISFQEFPELGSIHFKDKPYLKFWSYWLENGEQWTKQQFEKQWQEVENYRVQKSPEVIKKRRNLTQYGIAILPLLIEKIDNGEIESIDLVSTLTNGEIKKDATKEQVLKLWQENKERWLIFDDVSLKK